MRTLLAIIIAMLAVLPARAQQPPEPPYSCRLLYDEEKKCAFGSCDKRVVALAARVSEGWRTPIEPATVRQRRGRPIRAA
jgi:hypothetical protein